MDDQTLDSTTAIWTKLDRYLAGEASAHEAAAVQAMLARIPDAETILRLEYRPSSGNVRRRATLEASDWAHDGIPARWEEIVNQIALDDTTERRAASQPAQSPPLSSVEPPDHTGARVPKTVLPFTTPRRLLRVSLAGVAGLAIAVLGWSAGAGMVTKDLSTHVSTYATPAGKQATVTLPDGTELLLNVDSKVQVAGDFMNGNRSVRLEGEALFTVVHHSAEPFVVVTDGVRTKVLGTQFAVRAYPGDSITRVAVREGRVAVDDVVVASGEQLQFTGKPARGLAAVPMSASRQHFVFADGIVAFDDVRLGDAAHDLARWYDTRIVFQDASLKDLRISGEFSAKSIHDLIEVLEGTFKVKVVRMGSSVTISRR